MIHYFVHQDVLTGKRTLAPLGCIVLFIGLLFLGACGLGWYGLLTHNVTRLAEAEPPATATEAVVFVTPAPATSPAAALQAAPSPTATVRITATQTVLARQAAATSAARVASGITWTVTPVPIPGGGTIYDGPPEIKAAVLRDYVAAQKWYMDHLLDRDYLLAHLAEYYTDKEIAHEQDNIDEAWDKIGLISAPLAYQSRVSPPLDKPTVNQFSPDGTQALVSHFTGTDWTFYSTDGRKIVHATVDGEEWSYTLEFDPHAKRWKIARLVSRVDLKTNQETYADAPWRVIK